MTTGLPSAEVPDSPAIAETSRPAPPTLDEMIGWQAKVADAQEEAMDRFGSAAVEIVGLLLLALGPAAMIVAAFLASTLLGFGVLGGVVFIFGLLMTYPARGSA